MFLQAIPNSLNAMRSCILLTPLALLWSFHGLGQDSVRETCMTPIHPFSQYVERANMHEETLNNALTTYDMSQALAQLNDYWDGVLNDVYQDLIHTLECRASDDDGFELGSEEINPNLKMIEALRKGQRAWIQVRDADAEFGYYESFGGSMAPLSRTGIVLAKTKERAEELLQMNNNLKYPGGR